MSERLRQKDVARRLDLDVRQIRNLRKLGLPVKQDPQGDYYPWPECLHWYIERKREEERARTGDKRLHLAQLSEAEGRAELKQLELEERRRALIRADLALEVLSDFCALFRSTVQSFEGRLAPVLPGVQTPAEVRSRIKPVIDAALESVQESAVRLAQAIADQEDDEEEAEDAPPAADE